MSALAGWIAPVATMIAAMMTAANLGPRLTGWGFVVFALGSGAWIVIALSSGQQNLLLTNGFLMLVNVIGVWRWRGRQARYADGGKLATSKSAAGPVPTLISTAALPGSKLRDRSGDVLGVVVDAMMQCADANLAYVVVSDGGVAGIAEKLHVLGVHEVTFTEDGLRCDLDQDMFKALPELSPGDCPTVPKPR